MATAHRLYGEALTRDLAVRLASMWRRVDRRSIGASWVGMVPLAAGLIAEAQEAAVHDAGAYMAAAMAVQGIDPDGPAVAGDGLVGVASDGRPLETLLAAPIFPALHGIKRGESPDRAMGAGLGNLLLIAQTQVADAQRVAGGLVMASRDRPAGYVRQVNPGACKRCVILAGKWYRADAGFDRHPGCKCVGIPAAENVAGDAMTDPYEYFQSLSPEDRSKTFGDAGAKAIEDGADIFQVVNADRGMSTTAGGSKVTNEGVTRRGYWGSQQVTRDRRGGERYGRAIRQRMMPEEIYRRARNQNDVTRLLTEHGYITPAGQVPSGAIFGAGRGFAPSRYQ